MWVREALDRVSGEPTTPMLYDMLSMYTELLFPRLETPVHHPYSFGQIVCQVHVTYS